MNLKDIDLNKPAFGEGADPADLPVDDPSTDSQPEEESQVQETEAEEASADQEDEEPSDEDEQRVPYSRFKKFHDLAKAREEAAQAALEQAEYWRRMAELKESPAGAATQTTAPDWWVRMYGDSPESLEAWKIQDQQNEAFRQEVRKEAIESVRAELMQEEARESENVAYIDSELESLQEALGRPLSEKEQSALLDIVDEYTPKDDRGNYLGALVPFDKAWEIYELKTQAAKAPKQKARNAVAATSATGTSGEAAVSADRDRDFDPLNWNAWQNRV